jgi:hypothetical protein
MSKRPNFSEGLSKVREAGGRPAPTVSAPNPAVREAAGEGGSAAQSPPPSRQGKVAISAYFDPVVRQQLALLAVRQSRSQAALVAEALNLLFERHGESPIAKA